MSTNNNNNNKVLSALLKQVNKTKFSPCQSCPSLASNIIDRYFTASLRQRKTQTFKVGTGGNGGGGGGVGDRSNNMSDHLSLAGATNATLFSNSNCNYFYNHTTSSPTSSLISLNGGLSSSANCNGMSMGNINKNNNSNVLGAGGLRTNSPSPSPPPHGATASSSYYHHHQHFGNATTAYRQNLCFYVNESHTFTLPNEIEDFSPRIQHILYDELLDREVQQELEFESRIINWNKDLCKRLNSKLYPLWNRHSGDCLLDSVLQACYGVFDTDNTLRRVMAESLEQYANW
jgi:hypothetical protein